MTAAHKHSDETPDTATPKPPDAAAPPSADDKIVALTNRVEALEAELAESRNAPAPEPAVNTKLNDRIGRLEAILLAPDSEHVAHHGRLAASWAEGE